MQANVKNALMQSVLKESGMLIESSANDDTFNLSRNLSDNIDRINVATTIMD